MDSAQPKKSEAGARMPTIDPVCGMTVDPQKAAALFDYQGRTYFFCCAGCREKFKADPKHYLNPAAAAPIGIQREPKQKDPVATARGTDTTYICPMHPEIV